MSGHSHDHHTGLAEGRRITWVGIGVNAILIALKLWGGLAGRSRALIADAVHSISDFVSDFIVLIGLHFLGKAEDEEHPYGHGKIETLAAIGVGLLLLTAAAKIGYEAAMAIYRGDVSAPHRFTIIIAAVSVVAKEVLYQVTVRIGKRVGSEALVANAWHHRSDAWSSIITLGGVTAASFVPRLRILDSYAALFVSFFIVKVAAEILWSALRKIVDTAPSAEFVQAVRLSVERVPGVRQCHDIMARYYARRIRMELHIVVDPGMTVADAHVIIDHVVDVITTTFEDVEKVLVHVDPDRSAFAERKKGSTD
ncbi:MAG: cation-efflux pump [Chloroflexi bacterium]|nr:MAG: cation-efflux pump [Chloroflexota bacterium]